MLCNIPGFDILILVKQGLSLYIKKNVFFKNQDKYLDEYLGK